MTRKPGLVRGLPPMRKHSLNPTQHPTSLNVRLIFRKLQAALNGALRIFCGGGFEHPLSVRRRSSALDDDGGGNAVFGRGCAEGGQRFRARREGGEVRIGSDVD